MELAIFFLPTYYEKEKNKPTFLHTTSTYVLVRNSLDAKLKQEKHTRPAVDVVCPEFHYLQMLSRKIVNH